jgi:hypothetical protein
MMVAEAIPLNVHGIVVPVPIMFAKSERDELSWVTSGKYTLESKRGTRTMAVAK